MSSGHVEMPSHVGRASRAYGHRFDAKRNSSIAFKALASESMSLVATRIVHRIGGTTYGRICGPKRSGDGRPTGSSEVEVRPAWRCLI